MINTLLRALSAILMLVSLGCFAAAIALYNGWLEPPHPAELFTVDAAVKSFGEAKVGEQPVLTFKFHNGNDREVEIIGGNFG